MKRKTVRRMGGAVLAAALMITSVQPVMAEEAAPEAQNTEAAAQTAEPINAAERQSAEEEKPSITVDSVEWDGGALKIPVDLGNYTAEEVKIFFNYKDGIKNVTSLGKYEDGNAVYNFGYNIELAKGDEWFTKAGVYDWEIVFEEENGEAITKENFKVHVLEDSIKWQVAEENYVFDGSKDITFSFKNGTNLFEIQSVKWLGIFTGKGNAETPSVSVPDMTEGFTYDLEAGTLTINKDALKKTLASATSQNGGVLPDKIAINARSTTADGQEVYFNQIPYLTEQGFTVSKTAWWLDISKLNAESEKPLFDDVTKDAWFYEPVKYVKENGLMTGLNDKTFGPSESLARAQFAVILYRIEENPAVDFTDKFGDIGEDVWFTDAIMWASEADIVTGYSNGNFGPSDNINREQMALMMYRYANHKGYDTSEKADFSNFSDAANVSDFAEEAMQWAVGTGIISGKSNGTIDPQGDAARAECATIIQRFVTAYGM